MEFVQFHPTVLWQGAAARGQQPLISEAVRGEGAYLLNAAGERFMVGRHEMAELAPRDVVSRNIVRVMEEEGSENVFLDCRHLGADFVHERFPTIWDRLEERGIDMAHDLIPVAPAQHFHSGGILTELHGRSTLRGLYAVGESACSGVHGANRLASNSLVEGLVFATRAAADAASLVADGTLAQGSPSRGRVPLRSFPRRCAHGFSRSRTRVRAPSARPRGLSTAVATLADIRGRFHTMDAPAVMPQVAEWETSNVLACASLIAEAALAREESRGGHQRTDFPETDDARFKVRLAASLDPDGQLGLTRRAARTRVALDDARQAPRTRHRREARRPLPPMEIPTISFATARRPPRLMRRRWSSAGPVSSSSSGRLVFMVSMPPSKFAESNPLCARMRCAR